MAALSEIMFKLKLKRTHIVKFHIDWLKNQINILLFLILDVCGPGFVVPPFKVLL